MRSLVLLAFILYFLLSMVLPSYRLWKRTGVNPFTFVNDESAHAYVGKVFKLVMLMLLLNVIFFSIGGNWYEYLVPIPYLEGQPGMQFLGFVLLGLSLVWIMIAQYQMADSWRIGIDGKNKTSLITIGLFNKSRNPIFFGISVGLGGLFLITPNTLMLVVLVSARICIQVQVRLEEEFLEKTHGREYLFYKEKVRRWL